MKEIIHTQSLASGGAGVTTLEVLPHTAETGTLQLIVAVISVLPSVLNAFKQFIQIFKKRNDNEKSS